MLAPFTAFVYSMLDVFWVQYVGLGAALITFFVVASRAGMHRGCIWCTASAMHQLASSCAIELDCRAFSVVQV